MPYFRIRFSEMYRHQAASGYSIVWVSGKGTDAASDVLHREQEAIFGEQPELDFLAVEAHRVGDEVAGGWRGVVVAVRKRPAALKGIGLLCQQPGFAEGGRRGDDVSHAAAVQNVVNAFFDQQVELDHHGFDGLLVALQKVDRAGALFGGGVEPDAFGPLGDDPLFGLDRRHQLSLDAPFELGANVFGDVGRRANHVQSQPQGVQSRLGLVLAS